MNMSWPCKESGKSRGGKHVLVKGTGLVRLSAGSTFNRDDQRGFKEGSISDPKYRGKKSQQGGMKHPQVE